MAPTAYRERIDQTGETLAALQHALNDEERTVLGVELMDVTRGAIDSDAYQRALMPWVLTVIARENADFEPRVKEYNDLVSSGEIFSGVDLGGLPSQLT